jgi:hypothetical protein
MTKTDTAIEKLKSIGYTEEKLGQLMPLVLDDMEDQVAFDFAAVSSDEETEAFMSKLTVATSADDVKALLIEMSKKAYGESYLDKFDTMLAEELEKVAQMTSSMRDTYHKYMSGDPATVDAVNKAQNDPNMKKTLDDMQASGFDFVKAATE